MTNAKQRIVLESGVTPDDVQGIAWDLNWNAVEVGDRAADVVVDVWASMDGKTEIRFIDDRPIALRYFTVQGDNRDLVVREIEDACQVWHFGDAVAAIGQASSRDAKLIAIYAAALSATSDDRPAEVSLLQSLARDDDPALRQSVLLAAGYLGWPELIPLVEEIGQSDPEEFIRHNSAILLEGFRRFGTD
jgi:HEAT repeat protein